MNNPLRSLAQNRIEAEMFEKFGGRTVGQKVLEIGCGRGAGTEIIFERFRANEVHAFDLDSQMIGLVKKRLAKFPAEKLRLFVGDGTCHPYLTKRKRPKRRGGRDRFDTKKQL